MTPAGLDVTEELDARTVRVAPYPAVPAVGWVVAAGAFVAVVAALLGGVAGPVVGGLVALIAAPPLLAELEDARRSALRLALRIGRDDLRVRWLGLAFRPIERRVFLRDVHDVVAVEVSAGRWHVVVRTGGREVRIAMERDSEAAVRWLADAIRAASEAARARDGAGRREVPRALERLRTR